MSTSATIDPPQNTLRERAEALAYFYALNVLLLMIVGHGYLMSVPRGTSALGWLQTILACAANFAMWALVPLLLTLPTLLIRRAWITWIFTVVTFGALNVFFYVDSVIFQLWRFHFNGFVWNLLSTSGAGDTVTAGKATVISATLIVALILTAEIGLIGFAWPRLKVCGLVPRLRSGKSFGLALASVTGLIALDKVLYDVGDLRQDTEVLRIRQLLPLYQTATIRRFANRGLGMNVSPRAGLKLHPANGSFDYPKSPLRIDGNAPRPNIVLIALEGVRADALTPEIMPNTHRWAQQHLIFDNHYSSGNATRYGIFGLMYGIYGTYWQHALTERHGPAMVQALIQRGYEFRVLCCTDLNYPEFRSTAFVDVPAAITDKWNCTDRLDRDRLMTDEFIRFLGERRQPFFVFMFYDATHQPYRYPPDYHVFDTGGLDEEINYVRLTHDNSQIPHIFNRYKNSCRYADAQLGRTLDALDRQGLLTNTLVFIAGDHGEAFGEYGLFGHDSSFDWSQTKTLMVANIPGEPARRITRLTSHLDVPATIMKTIGVANPASDYIQGLPLLSEQDRPFLFFASWGDAAIRDSQSVISFGLEAYKAETTIADTNNAPLPNQRAALTQHQQELVAALQGMRYFTR